MSSTPTRPPKAIVFDLGNVLVRVDYGIAARAMSLLSRGDALQVRQAIDQSPLLHELESGRIDFERFTEEVRAQIGYTGDQAAFRRTFSDIFAPIPAMIDFHASLRDAGIPTFILSNTNDAAVEFITAQYPFFQTFTGYVFSHQVGCMKPAMGIYEAVEKLAGFSGADLFFIDDRSENVEAAWARGWQGIVHSDPAVTIRECTSRLAG